MKSGDIVKVITQCVPKGLIPPFYAKLHYEYESEGKRKWYAIKTDDNSFTESIDSSNIYLLNPPA